MWRISCRAKRSGSVLPRRIRRRCRTESGTTGLTGLRLSELPLDAASAPSNGRSWLTDDCGACVACSSGTTLCDFSDQRRGEAPPGSRVPAPVSEWL